MTPGSLICAIKPLDIRTSATKGVADSSPVMTVGEVKRISVAMVLYFH